LEYSLIERHIEREHVPAAQELGIAICPWSPLAGGFLTGKYKREGSGTRGEGRIEKTKGSPFAKAYTDPEWRTLGALVDVAKQLSKTPAQVALNWVVTQPGMTSTILGATTLAQLNDNLEAVEFAIPAELRKQIDEASSLKPVHPYTFFGPPILTFNSGGVSVEPWTPARVTGGPAGGPPHAKASAARE
jgi:aryl-alcohol dehydrogenase-like predicted oxidoreductase